MTGDVRAIPPANPPAKRPAPARRGEPAASTSYRVIVFLLAAVSVATVLALGWSGRDYYGLSLAKRVRSPLHDSLKPGGTVGRRLAVVGSGLMLLNLAYMLRRRVKGLEKLGTQRLWLEVHVFCGLTGPAILVFHSAFLTTNLFARITAASTALVVGAGLVGRYVYGQLPRNIYGKELTLAELRAEQRALLDELAGELPPGEDEEADLASFAIPEPAGKKGAPRLILHSLHADLHRLVASVRLARRLRAAGLGRGRAWHAARTTARAATLGLRITKLHLFQRILARWRGVHLKLALVMVVAMVLHVAVVTALGYGLW